MKLTNDVQTLFIKKKSISIKNSKGSEYLLSRYIFEKTMCKDKLGNQSIKDSDLVTVEMN